MSNRLTSLFAFGVLLTAISPAAAEEVMRSDADLMKVLKTAAPPAIVEQATIMNMGADGKMKTIQQGTNGWTCMDPGSHGNGEPMCADKAAMDWAGTWQNKQPPSAPVGFVYMLNGDSGVSNTDPYNKDTQPSATNNWVQTGPHVMIVGTDAKTMFQSYPRDAKADPTKPYVMWPGTPYEHLMLPVNRSASAAAGGAGAMELGFMPSAMDVTLLNEGGKFVAIDLKKLAKGDKCHMEKDSIIVKMGPGSPGTTRVRYAAPNLSHGGCPFMTEFELSDSDYATAHAAFTAKSDEANKKLTDLKKQLGDKWNELTKQ